MACSSATYLSASAMSGRPWQIISAKIARQVRLTWLFARCCCSLCDVWSKVWLADGATLAGAIVAARWGVSIHATFSMSATWEAVPMAFSRGGCKIHQVVWADWSSLAEAFHAARWSITIDTAVILCCTWHTVPVTLGVCHGFFNDSSGQNDSKLEHLFFSK